MNWMFLFLSVFDYSVLITILSLSLIPIMSPSIGDTLSLHTTRAFTLVTHYTPEWKNPWDGNKCTCRPNWNFLLLISHSIPNSDHRYTVVKTIDLGKWVIWDKWEDAIDFVLWWVNWSMECNRSSDGTRRRRGRRRSNESWLERGRKGGRGQSSSFRQILSWCPYRQVVLHWKSIGGIEQSGKGRGC